jgi:hypothetical protein
MGEQVNNGFGKNLNVTGLGLSTGIVLIRNLRGGTHKHLKTLQSGWLFSRPKFEMVIFRKEVRSVTA